MNNVKYEILNKIKEYDSIVIGRHFRPDGDAVGSTMGLSRIISLTFPEKKVYLSNKDKSDYMAFLGDTSDLIEEDIIKNSLVIVIDTATEDRVSDDRILNGKEIIKIMQENIVQNLNIKVKDMCVLYHIHMVKKTDILMEHQLEK